jgi:hypothetical protein
MTSIPLVFITPERQARELNRARAAAESDRAEHRRFLRIVALCYAWGVLGVALIGLSFHLTGFDRPQAALLGGILLLIGGPSWTLILSHWVETQGR